MTPSASAAVAEKPRAARASVRAAVPASRVTHASVQAQASATPSAEAAPQVAAVSASATASATPAPATAKTPAPVSPAPAKCDRRSLRSQHLLRQALADELNGGTDLTQVTVAALTERAGLTRRTFYTHYRDIPDFIEQVEAGILTEIRVRIAHVAATDLPSLYRNIEDLEPAPGSVELLSYLKRDGAVIGALLGPGGDAAFVQRIMDIARDTVADRMKTGIFPGVLGTFFDYYLAYVVAAEMGIVQRWFATGLREAPETMARIMTVAAFVRPGDLYGKPIDINVPAYGMKLMGLNLFGPQTDAHDDADSKEDIDG